MTSCSTFSLLSLKDSAPISPEEMYEPAAQTDPPKLGFEQCKEQQVDAAFRFKALEEQIQSLAAQFEVVRTQGPAQEGLTEIDLQQVKDEIAIHCQETQTQGLSVSAEVKKRKALKATLKKEVERLEDQIKRLSRKVSSLAIRRALCMQKNPAHLESLSQSSLRFTGRNYARYAR